MNKNRQLPETLIEAIQYFADEDNSFEFMKSIRWPSGVVKCPRCNSKDVSFISTRKIWKCKHCATNKQFSVKVGTVMEDSPIGLDKWLAAFWLIANAKNGISSYELHRSLGVTQKTAWFMLHRIRLAMQDGKIFNMKGICEADETYIGAKARYMHKDRRTPVGDAGIHKTPIQGILERGKGKKASRVVLKVVKTTRRPELCANVRQHVKAGSTVCTDALMSYDDLERDYDREIIDHLECYARGKVHTNGLENFWSLLKRALKGTYVNVEPFHLFRYCDEQAFRFNERKDNDQGRFVRALQGVFGKTLKYAKLIAAEGGDGPCPETWQTA
ncbi:MAG TPA: IS1595 family transposase [Chthoniobacterales bacterium]|jgi:transposase-like protein